MKVLSVCVSKIKLLTFDGVEVETGIFKDPIDGPVRLGRLNLDGDEQADLTVHGGVDKALYTYPSEHYPLWRQELPGVDLPWGAFGENLTTEGMLESEVCIGDEFEIGTAIVRVSQPRLPCYKLGLKIPSPGIIKAFMKSGRSGIYFSVVKEGILTTGDTIRFLRADGNGITVQEVAQIFTRRDNDSDRIQKILASNLAAQFKKSVADFARRH